MSTTNIDIYFVAAATKHRSVLLHSHSPDQHKLSGLQHLLLLGEKNKNLRVFYAYMPKEFTNEVEQIEIY